MKTRLLCFLMIASAGSGLAQSKLRTVALTDSLLQTAIDRPGDFYTVGRNGNIQRYDKDGNLLLTHTTESIPTLFDPRDGARLFLYYRADQFCEFVNPSFQSIAAYPIDPSFAVEPWLVCPSGEYKLWILDRADNSLKQIDLKTSQVEVEVAVDPALVQAPEAFTMMRDYQGFVFLLDPSRGILVFNRFGKHLRTIDVAGITSFNFLGEELYFIEKGRLTFFNLFNAETRTLDIPPGYAQVLLTDERMVLVARKSIDIFPFSP